MRSIAIVTDSNCGMSPAQARELGVHMLPMPFFIDDKEYLEDIDMNQAEFFRYLEQNPGCRVSTSQPTPESVTDLWDKLLKDYDEIVHIPMSSGLSASCATAISLSDDYDGKVQIADNHRISVTQRESVMHAKKLADAGKSAKEIKEVLEAEAYNSSIYIAVDTLEFLKKGGRVTAAGAALGSVLNIKPILTIQGGKLDAFAKTRGMKKCKQKMVEALKNDRETRFKDADDKHLLIGAAGSNLTEEEAEEWKQMLVEAFPDSYVYYNPLSFSVGCHIGPKGYGMGISVCSTDYDV